VTPAQAGTAAMIGIFRTRIKGSAVAGIATATFVQAAFFAVLSVLMLSGLFAITPGGVGQTQALDVATLRNYAPSGDIAAFSITQDAVMTIWNVVLGVAVLIWAFGFGAAKDMLFRRNKEPEQPAVAS
jgi:hypothetical protein